MNVSDSRIGSKLAGYRIEALLGRGGMGVVYRAHDLALDRKVALKILSPELAEDVHFRERFLTESRLAASIDHPSIVPVYDAGEVAGQLYLAMRYVEGSDLKRLLEQGPLPRGQAIAIVSQVAGALDAAHERGLVHRDIKPSNVLLDESEHAYLADFGLSRRLGEAGAALGAARSLGTIDYVAPEQIRSEEVDGRADLYSLGCLLYECVTGSPPFARSSDAAVLFAHLEEEPPATHPLEEVMRTALAKDPDERFQTGRELVEAARKALGLERRRVGWPLAAATVGLALIAAALLAFFLTHRGGGIQAERGADSLVRIDPNTNKVTGKTPVGRQATAVAFGAGAVWVANFGDGTVWRLDPKTQRVLAKIPARGTPTGLAISGPSLLVADGPDLRTIAIFDAATGTFRYATRLPGLSYNIPFLAAGPAGAWFTDTDTQSVASAETLLTGTYVPISIPAVKGDLLSQYVAFAGIAVGTGAVWVIGDAFARSVWRIDPATNRILAHIRLPFVPRGIAAGEGGVWITSVLDDTVTRLDPASNRIAATIRCGRGANAIATGAGSVWVTNEIAGTVTRIDPRTDRAVATLHVGGRPGAIAVGGGGVWVAVGRQ